MIFSKSFHFGSGFSGEAMHSSSHRLHRARGILSPEIRLYGKSLEAIWLPDFMNQLSTDDEMVHWWQIAIALVERKISTEKSATGSNPYDEKSACRTASVGCTGEERTWFFLLLLSLVLCPALVDDEAVDGVGGGVAEELDLGVDDFEVELCFGFGEEV
jgi:hypothetical protein